MTEELKDLQSLLTQVGVIKQKYDQIAEITGEKFNIFSILGLQDREVRLHSALLNELLNPNGIHGQKDLFLKLFIIVINKKIKDEASSNKIGNISNQKITDFKTETAVSNVEIHAGFINKEKTEGGYIDILVNDNHKHAIIIENKIWAGDQQNQIFRYNNHGNNSFKTFHLIYLTIDGKQPSSWSTGEKITDNEFLCISYQDEIIHWLELCRKECTQLPIIRETITQYINQLKNYSGKSINHMEQTEFIKTIIKTSDNIDLAFKINSSINDVKIQLVELLVANMGEIAKNENFILEKDIHSRKYSYFSFYKQNWRFCLCFEFTSNDFEDLQFGICLIDNNTPENQDKQTNERIKSKFPNMNENPYWAAVEDCSEWNNIAWKELIHKETAEILFKKLITTANILESIPNIKL